ncbi:putative serine dehydratase domain-containing protein [Schizophyllum fasciatum]
MVVQTKTPIDLLALPDKERLVAEYRGKGLNEVRTPAFVIDRKVFADNCARMHSRAKDWDASFRAHLKTHKTAEGSRLQMVSSSDKTSAVVVSTLMEAWSVVRAGLFRDGTIQDLLYGLPIGINKVQDVSDLWDEVAPSGGVIRLLIDHPNQVKFLEEFESKREKPRRWSAFVKIDGGQKRAGVGPKSTMIEELLKTLTKSPAVSIYGFYAHAGNAYASTSQSEASKFLTGEVNSVNDAAEFAFSILGEGVKNHQQPFVLSVGSTPTAHSASAETRAKVSTLLHGKLELHAGNYPMLDLQQQSTSMIGGDNIAQKVIATVVSVYPGRGEDGGEEAIVDAGAIAFSKDTGPSGGFGDVIGKNWRVGRVSQEHGILTRKSEGPVEKLALGDTLEIVGQHACLIAAAYPWYYIVDSDVEQGREIVDVWVPWKGW